MALPKVQTKLGHYEPFYEPSLGVSQITGLRYHANCSWARNTSESMQHLLHAIHAIAWNTQNGLFWFETVCHTVKNRYYTAACVHLYYIRGLLHALHVINI